MGRRDSAPARITRHRQPDTNGAVIQVSPMWKQCFGSRILHYTLKPMGLEVPRFAACSRSSAARSALGLPSVPWYSALRRTRVKSAGQSRVRDPAPEGGSQPRMRRNASSTWNGKSQEKVTRKVKRLIAAGSRGLSEFPCMAGRLSDTVRPLPGQSGRRRERRTVPSPWPTHVAA